MDNDIKKIIKDRMQKLPETAVKALQSIHWIDSIKNISETNKFDQDTEDSFTIEVIIMVLGMESPESFPLNLSEKVGLNDEVVTKVANEVGEMILNPLKDNLDKSAEIKNRDIDNVQSKENPKLDKAIESRVSEITTKYSLSNEKGIILSAEIAKSINNPQLPKISVDILIEKLDISGLIAEQILNDLNNRIFNSSIKTAKVTESTSSVNMANQMNQGVTTASIPNYTPRPKVVIDDEPVQTPIPVPRFKAVPMSDIESGQDFMPKVAPKPNVGGIMQNKLNTVTEKAPARPPVPEKYSVDPYREPLN